MKNRLVVYQGKRTICISGEMCMLSIKTKESCMSGKMPSCMSEHNGIVVCQGKRNYLSLMVKWLSFL